MYLVPTLKIIKEQQRKRKHKEGNNKVKNKSNEVENRKVIETNQSKCWFFVKQQISTTDKPLADPIKEEREKTQIRNKNKEITKNMTKF